MITVIAPMGKHESHISLALVAFSEIAKKGLPGAPVEPDATASDELVPLDSAGAGSRLRSSRGPVT
eukprot:578535-Amphidinium_carterae.1